MAGVKDGFGVTLGVILALILIPAIGVMVFCGGCAAIVGVGVTAPAVQQAREAAERARQRNEQRATEPAPVQAEPGVMPQPGDQPKPAEEPQPIENEAPAANPEPAAAALPDPVKAEVQDPPKGEPGEKDEKAAASALKLAKSVFLKSEDAGRRRLREIVEKFPGTEAAAEAEKMLAK